MLGRKLRNLRQQKGITQREIAAILNIDRSTYTYYEGGRTLPDIQTVARLAKMYGVTVDYLLSDSDEEPAQANRSYMPQLHDNEVQYATKINNGNVTMSLNQIELQLIQAFRYMPLDLQNETLRLFQEMLAKRKRQNNTFYNE